MDLSNPLKTVTPTLDAAVLQVLAATTGWVTGGEAHRRAGTGSPDGVRRVLARLVGQGIVVADPHPHATLYLLNREHVCEPMIVRMVRVRTEIIDRITAALLDWPTAPLSSSLFGSFARGQADEHSDIDVLLVEPADLQREGAARDGWDDQVELLAAGVLRWTGNRAQVLSVSVGVLAAMVAAGDPLIASWRADHMHLSGVSLVQLLRTAS